MNARRVIAPTTVAALDCWAAQKRRLYVQGSEPLPSMFGKLRNERNAASYSSGGQLRQSWPEVYTGDGLLVERIIHTLHELPRITVTYYYVLRWPWRVPIPQQAADIGITRRQFWNELRVAEVAVETGLQLIGDIQTQEGALSRQVVSA